MGDLAEKQVGHLVNIFNCACCQRATTISYDSRYCAKADTEISHIVLLICLSIKMFSHLRKLLFLPNINFLQGCSAKKEVWERRSHTI